jgi:hypothetical protein
MMPARPDPRAAAREAFGRALGRFDNGRAALILGHFDADGLSAVAVLKRALERAGRAADVRLAGKGENPWSAELAERSPGGLIVAGLGVRGASCCRALAPSSSTIMFRPARRARRSSLAATGWSRSRPRLCSLIGAVKATGGALRPADWNEFVIGLGFPEEKVDA